MKICKGVSASPGLVLGQVSRLERHVETFSTGPFDPGRDHVDQRFADGKQSIAGHRKPPDHKLQSSQAAPVSFMLTSPGAG